MKMRRERSMLLEQDFLRRQHLKGSKILRRLNIKEIGGGVKESECLSSFVK